MCSEDIHALPIPCFQSPLPFPRSLDMRSQMVPRKNSREPQMRETMQCLSSCFIYFCFCFLSFGYFKRGFAIQLFSCLCCNDKLTSILWLAGMIWFILLKMMLSSPGYFPEGDRTSLFMGEWAPLCTHTAFSLCARPLMGALADSRIWLWWSATINTEMWTPVRCVVLQSFGRVPTSGKPGPMFILPVLYGGPFVMISTVAAPSCIPTSSL